MSDPCVQKISWRREWLPTPVFLPEEVHGQKSLVGYNLCDPKELDMTKQLIFSLSLFKYTQNLHIHKKKNLPSTS